jgi:predicted O-methyltransferase YrrM
MVGMKPLVAFVPAVALAIVSLYHTSSARVEAQAKPAGQKAPAVAAKAMSLPAPDLPAELARQLQEMKSADTDQLAVSEEDGRLLRVLIASNRSKRALEIGAANGYSAIWIGLGLRETGGKLVSIEYDPARARQAQANVRRAGLSDIVTVIPGDAFKEIPRLSGEFDFVFLDAWKKDYKRFLDLVWPRLTTGGLFLGHNVVNKKDEMPDFLDAITRNPAAITSIVTPSGEGISITFKRYLK